MEPGKTTTRDMPDRERIRSRLGLSQEGEAAIAGDQWEQEPSRRSLLKVMGASLALMGLEGCYFKNPQGTLVPYPQQPGEIEPGRPLYFATAMPFDGYGKGVLALSREGRPIKIEGNPDHPASLGGTDVFMQASILDLYDPDRSRNVLQAGEISQWGTFQQALAERLKGKAKDGRGLRLLSETVTSPTLAAQLREFARRFPGAAWHVHDPVRRPHGVANNTPFSSALSNVYDPRRAAVIVSFGSDFLIRDPGSVRYAKQFIDGRRVRRGQAKMSRLYVVESTMTVTGSMADNRLPLRPSQIARFVRALAARLGAEVPASAIANAELKPAQQRWLDAIVEDLTHVPVGEATLVLAGDYLPPEVHGLVHAIHHKLNNDGKTVKYIDPVEE